MMNFSQIWISLIDKILTKILTFLSLIYRIVLSPLIHSLFGSGYGCRFQPTCSRYSIESVRLHGSFRGILLTLFRLLRCHPFSKGGYDPVHPPSKEACFNSHSLSKR